mmetsp:Transcript_78855/g.235012  ORF Transcript_78855/g.235012 Transcript_78855/m.235012 type:complete len:300 (+) Transcript_78855:444-1343(+)
MLELEADAGGALLPPDFAVGLAVRGSILVDEGAGLRLRRAGGYYLLGVLGRLLAVRLPLLGLSLRLLRLLRLGLCFLRLCFLRHIRPHIHAGLPLELSRFGCPLLRQGLLMLQKELIADLGNLILVQTFDKVEVADPADPLALVERRAVLLVTHSEDAALLLQAGDDEEVVVPLLVKLHLLVGGTVRWGVFHVDRDLDLLRSRRLLVLRSRRRLVLRGNVAVCCSLVCRDVGCCAIAIGGLLLLHRWFRRALRRRLPLLHLLNPLEEIVPELPHILQAGATVKQHEAGPRYSHGILLRA